MNVATIAGLLRERAQLHTHDGWTDAEVLAYQARRLADLRAYAVAHSPFYQDLHRGLEGTPLHSIPVAVDLVDAIPRTALGKAALIRRAELATAAH